MSSDPCALDPSSPTGSQNVQTVHVWVCPGIPGPRCARCHVRLGGAGGPDEQLSPGSYHDGVCLFVFLLRLVLILTSEYQSTLLEH